VRQVAVCSQTDTKHINTVWAERTIVKIFNLLVHPVTSRLLKVKLPAAVNDVHTVILPTRNGRTKFCKLRVLEET
jgi:hypothetical protein